MTAAEKKNRDLADYWQLEAEVLRKRANSAQRRARVFGLRADADKIEAELYAELQVDPA